MACHDRLLTDAYLVALDLTEALRDGQSFFAALRTLERPFDSLDDGYPDWHPAPYSFDGMIHLFIYREFTAESYRELADVFGLEKIPDESVLSRTWRNRFDEAIREFVTTAAHYVVKEVHYRNLCVPEARPKEDVVTPRRDSDDFRRIRRRGVGRKIHRRADPANDPPGSRARLRRVRIGAGVECHLR